MVENPGRTKNIVGYTSMIRMTADMWRQESVTDGKESLALLREVESYLSEETQLTALRHPLRFWSEVMDVMEKHAMTERKLYTYAKQAVLRHTIKILG